MTPTSADLYVVPSDRHVERLAAEGERAETRTSLRDRLVARFLPDAVVVDAAEALLALSFALADARPRAVGAPSRQMDLFSGRAPTTDVVDPLLVAARARGGTSWTRMVSALDSAITTLRGRNVTSEDVRRAAAGSGVAATRARTLSLALDGLDERLARAGAVDGRRVGPLLAEALRDRPREEIIATVGALRVRARWLLSWSRADLAWWRVLDDVLSRAGGWMRIQLPVFDRPLEGTREHDPLESLADEISKAADAAPESEIIAMVVGDLTGAPPPILDERVGVLESTDAAGQARAVAAAVANALASGANVERVVVAAPVLDEASLAPLRRAFEAVGVMAHESRGAPPSGAAVVVAAVGALEAADVFDRRAVAHLLRSPYIDASALAVDHEPHEAERIVLATARALELSATSSGSDPVERLARTASSAGGDEDVIRRLHEIFGPTRAAKTRGAHLRSARRVWADLGFTARAGRGGLATFGRDTPPEGVARLERAAIAHDARSWDAMIAALDEYGRIAERGGGDDQPIDLRAFLVEVTELLDGAASRPGAGRSGAVRVMRLADVPGDELDLLVIIDANDGTLPREDAHDALLSESFWAALVHRSRGSVAPPTSAERRAHELAALALACADARRVLLSHTAHDAMGAPRAPSFVVDALVRGGVPSRSTPNEPLPPASAAALHRASRERDREVFFLDPARSQSEIVGRLASTSEIASIISAETGGGDRALSVTGLERFARCPFMGFAHVVLGARDVELREELPDAREEGTVVHEALAAAFVATRTYWARRPRDEAAIMDSGIAAADAVLSAWQGHAPLRAIARLRVRDSVRAVLEAAVTDEEWDFERAEQSFGMRSRSSDSWPTVTLHATALENPDAKVVLSLRGSIDRVDRRHDDSAVRVIDYKRSKSTVRAASASLGDAAIQVPLYACVASRHYGCASDGLYLPTQPKDIDSATPARAAERMRELVTRADLNELAPIERRALALVASARAGRFAPVPSDETECRVCSVSGGCRKPRFAMKPAEEVDDQA